MADRKNKNLIDYFNSNGLLDRLADGDSDSDDD